MKLKFSIFSKLLLGFASVLLLTACIAGLGVYDLSLLTGITNEIVSGPEEVKYLARHAESQLRDATAKEKEFLALQNQALAQEFINSAKQARSLAEKITSISNDARIQADAKELCKHLDMYTKGFNDLLSEIYVKSSGDEPFTTVVNREVSVQAIYKQYTEEAKAATTLSNGIVSQAERQADAALAMLAEKSTSTRFVLIIITIIALVAGVVLAFFLARALSHPILILNAAAQRVASGEQGVKIDIRTNDEVQELGNAFNRMVASIDGMVENLNKSNTDVTRILSEVNLQKETSETGRHHLEDEVTSLAKLIDALAQGFFFIDIFTESDIPEVVTLRERLKGMVETLRFLIMQVQEAVATVSQASKQMGVTADEFAEGMRSQARQSEMVSVAMDTMTDTISANSRTASETAGVAVKNGDIAKRSSEIVLQTVEKMSEIAQVVQNSALTIEKLGESSAQIGEIVSVITEIADQTNLLALNAAIEAARAGDQGRGFAVVADEVRKLAERTQQATKQITGMISTIQKESNGAVKAMKKGSEKVREGIDLAQKAGSSLHDVVQSSESVLHMVETIASASREQTNTSAKIAANVEQIALVSSQSVQGVFNIAQNVGQIENLTDQLQERISKFKVHEDGSLPRRALDVLTRFHDTKTDTKTDTKKLTS
ncbi:MAG: HAMP domain-containing protein [Candidatus Kapaibacterium sp.]|nr:MAG: HAMP domain-containing protein [Candidatus Kapabacteria bacterium]